MQENQTRSARVFSRSRSETLAQRQARVGIIANPATVSLPVIPPRDTWVRWPKLRSARRNGGKVAGRDPEYLNADPVLSGSALTSLARSFRDDSPVTPDDGPSDRTTSEADDRERDYRAVLADMSIPVSKPEPDPGPSTTLRLVRWCGTGLLCIAVALILLSFLRW